MDLSLRWIDTEVDLMKEVGIEDIHVELAEIVYSLSKGANWDKALATVGWLEMEGLTFHQAKRAYILAMERFLRFRSVE
jgi:O-methyltransferase involved in polyketide biosynthesis